MIQTLLYPLSCPVQAEFKHLVVWSWDNPQGRVELVRGNKRGADEMTESGSTGTQIRCIGHVSDMFYNLYFLI